MKSRGFVLLKKITMRARVITYVQGQNKIVHLSNVSGWRNYVYALKIKLTGVEKSIPIQSILKLFILSL